MHQLCHPVVIDGYEQPEGYYNTNEKQGTNFVWNIISYAVFNKHKMLICISEFLVTNKFHSRTVGYMCGIASFDIYILLI
jgi:hypothetical protein